MKGRVFPGTGNLPYAEFGHKEWPGRGSVALLVRAERQTLDIMIGY